MATSWAKISRVSTKEICHAITWLGTCIFAKHYCLDLTGSSFRTAAQFLRHRCTCPPRAKSTLNTVFSPPRPLPLNFASSVGSVVLVPQLYLGTRLQVVNLGFPLCDALHPLGCTPVFARKKKKNNYRLSPCTCTVSAPCFPCWSLLRSNACMAELLQDSPRS